MDRSKQRIFFRADGNSKMGLGHLVRSSALAQMISADYCCILATRCTIPDLLSDSRSIFDEVKLIDETLAGKTEQDVLGSVTGSDLLVLDGYAFDEDYQKNLMEKGIDFFCIDDIHSFPFFARVIINHSGGLSPKDYKALPDTQFYLGPRYALLRPEFLKAALQRRRKIENNKCFICFGGADPANKTLEVLKKDLSVFFSVIHVVVGSAYQHINELKDFVQSHGNIIIHQSLPVKDMAGVMKECAFAICSPSTIVYEYMSAGGVVFLEQIADNQKDVINFMVKAGLAYHLSQLGSISHDEMQSSLDLQSTIFDGGSGERIQKIFRQYFESRNMNIRKAEEKDLLICFQWANDPVVRSQSYNTSSISLEGHTAWFNSKLKDPACYFYILEMDGKPVAQIRFQLNGNEAVLGYLAGEQIRNKGLGTAILGKGIKKFTDELKQSIKITGFVKNSNIPSQRSFERLSFCRENSLEYNDSVKYTMNYEN